MDNMVKGVLYGSKEPTPEQKARFINFIKKTYKSEDVELEYVFDESYINGFRLEVGNEIYDWSVEHRLRNLKEQLEKIHASENQIVPLMKDTTNHFSPDIYAEEIGRVISVGDEIATVTGLDNATYGEILLFNDGVKGMVMEISRDSLSCVLFGDGDIVTEGSIVRRSGKTAGVPVSDGFLGRVVDALGRPIDGRGEITSNEYRPIEKPAPGILDRQPVDKPMETGLLAIDSMFPIGRGQRELIIGDRQTGKTAIAIDTILNQKGKDVICVYTAIGQKASSVSHLVENLKKHDALDYCVIVNSTASDAASLQYIAPYSATAIAEYFMDKGKDVLIVYDDLSKHAIAYRALSLLLERSPGREAYPGDVFYLHSRLLERSAHLSDELGGGSITALPIVETQAGDVSAYIPTNIISITDGQIFLESDLFFSGQRPAVNVGLSVSRVGGAAQTKAMKKAAGTIRLDLAQYREMEVFTQFSSDLDETTKKQLMYGEGLMRLLRQPQYSPFKQHEQVIILVSALARVMMDIKTGEILEFREALIKHFEAERKDIIREINETNVLSDDIKASIIDASKQFKEKWLAQKK